MVLHRLGSADIIHVTVRHANIAEITMAHRTPAFVKPVRKTDALGSHVDHRLIGFLRALTVRVDILGSEVTTLSPESFDRFEIRRTIDEWGVFRDSGQWASLRALFCPGAMIRVAWYEGHFENFVELSRAGSGKGFAKHIICNSAIQVKGDRAIAETNAMLIGRGNVDGAACHGETHLRYLDCLARSRDGRWQIADRATIYDHDLVVPLSSVDGPNVLAGAASWPVEYRYLAARLTARGLAIPGDLATKGSETENTARLRCAAWLTESGGLAP